MNDDLNERLNRQLRRNLWRDPRVRWGAGFVLVLCGVFAFGLFILPPQSVTFHTGIVQKVDFIANKEASNVVLTVQVNGEILSIRHADRYNIKNVDDSACLKRFTGLLSRHERYAVVDDFFCR